MLTQQALVEVVTLPEAVALAERLGYSVDRSNLLRYARSGRLIARKSQGTWLTTRSALKALVVELSAATTRPAAGCGTGLGDSRTVPRSGGYPG